MKVNFFRKVKSMEKRLVIEFIFAIILVIFFSTIGFYILVNKEFSQFSMLNSISEMSSKQLFHILQEGIIIIIANTVIISTIIIRISNKTLAEPLKKIIDATKNVANGDFNIRLETNRNDEIKELVDNFNTMAKQLGENELLQKDFIDNVSHEIRTPINSIQGFTKLLDDETLNEEGRKEYISIILEETDRLLNLSNNILKLAKLQHQEKITNLTQINLSEQMKKVIALLEPKWKDKNIKFTVISDLIYVYGDEDLLFQAWTNLLDNAIKFSKNNGEIVVKIKENAKNVTVSIKDNGIGMAESEIQKIYSRFYQIDKSHSGEGSGLGLSIVKRIIDLSNGNLKVESKENEGTMFIVELPKIEKKNKILI